MLLRRISESLLKLGLEKDDFDVLLFAPVAAVAWADDDLSETALTTLVQCEVPAGLDIAPLRLSLSARSYLETHFLLRQPDEAELERLLDLGSEYLESIPYRQAQELRDRIAAMCIYVADAAGGVLGLFNRISEREKTVLKEVAERLSLATGHEACQVLHDLGLCDEEETGAG